MDQAAVDAYIQQQVAAHIAAIPAPAPAQRPAPAPAPIIKPTTPTTYSGERNEDVDLWIWLVDKWLVAGRVTPEIEKLTLATSLLRGAALAWWRHRERELGYPIDWTSFQVELRNNFQTINPLEVYRAQVLDLRQTTNVIDYATTFRNIALNIPSMTDEEKKFMFIHGLKSRTQEEVRMHNPDTFEAAVRLAARFDMVYRPQPSQDYQEGYPAPTHPAVQPGINGPAPMEIDGVLAAITKVLRQLKGDRYSADPRPKLTSEIRQQLMEEGRCWKCRQKGHVVGDCPET